jgi:hypothetical protein
MRHLSESRERPIGVLTGAGQLRRQPVADHVGASNISDP